MSINNYSKCTNFALAFLILFISTSFRFLEIFAIGLIVINILFYKSHFKECNLIFKENRRLIYTMLFLPIISLIIGLIHLDGRIFGIALTFFVPFLALLSLKYVRPSVRLLLVSLILSCIITLFEVTCSVSHNASRFNPTIYNTIYSGLFVSSLASITLYIVFYFLQQKKYSLSFVFIVCLLVEFIACFYMASKGAILYLLFAAFVIPFFFVAWKKYILCALCFLALFIGAFEFNKDSSYVTRMSSMVHSVLAADNGDYEKSSTDSTDIRLQLYRASIICASEHLTGCNPDQAKHVKQQLIQEGKITKTAAMYKHFHSDFFNSLGKMGILGVLAWVLFWGSLFKLVVRERRLIMSLSAVLIISFFINALFDSMMAYGKGEVFLLALAISAAMFSNKFLPKKSS